MAGAAAAAAAAALAGLEGLGHAPDPDPTSEHERWRREAARALASGVTSGECKVLQVVQTLGPLLTTDSAHKRLQGMLVLADVLGMCSGALDVGEVDQIGTFLCERMKDWHTLRATLAGCKGLLKGARDAAALASAAKVVNALFASVDVQSHSQPNRQLSFEVLDLALGRHGAPLLRALEEDALEALSRLVDGEKDPRCLLAAFGCFNLTIGALVSTGNEDLRGEALHADRAEAAADVLSCYFPLSFSPPPVPPQPSQKRITRDDLLQGLFSVYASCPELFPQALGLLKDRMPSPKPGTKREGIMLLTKCLEANDAATVATHAEEIWQLLRGPALAHTAQLATVPTGAGAAGGAGADDAAAEEALACARLASRMADGKVTPESIPFLEAVLSDPAVKAAREAAHGGRGVEGDARAALAAVARVASASPAALQVRILWGGLGPPPERAPVYEREGPPPYAYVEGAPSIMWRGALRGKCVKQRKLQGES